MSKTENTARKNAANDAAAKSSYETYRDGGSTAEILFTIQLVLAARRWRSLLDEKLRSIQQSSARMEAMSAIFNTRGRPAQIDIAKRLRIEGPTLTRMLDTLQKDGLVDRLPDPSDRRTNQLQLTDEGMAVLEQIFDVADIYRGRLLEDVSPEMLDTLNQFLHQMLEKLDHGLPDETPVEKQP